MLLPGPVTIGLYLPWLQLTRLGLEGGEGGLPSPPGGPPALGRSWPHGQGRGDEGQRVGGLPPLVTALVSSCTQKAWGHLRGVEPPAPPPEAGGHLGGENNWMKVMLTSLASQVPHLTGCLPICVSFEGHPKCHLLIGTFLDPPQPSHLVFQVGCG